VLPVEGRPYKGTVVRRSSPPVNSCRRAMLVPAPAREAAAVTPRSFFLWNLEKIAAYDSMTRCEPARAARRAAGSTHRSRMRADLARLSKHERARRSSFPGSAFIARECDRDPVQLLTPRDRLTTLKTIDRVLADTRAVREFAIAEARNGSRDPQTDRDWRMDSSSHVTKPTERAFLQGGLPYLSAVGRRCLTW
jgi:hypothetical protein